MNKRKPPGICPVCGQDVPSNSLACPECGADHNSGWREDADTYDAVDLPDDDFNYEEFVAKEFGSTRKPARLTIVWWLTGLILIVLFLVLCFYRPH